MVDNSGGARASLMGKWSWMPWFIPPPAPPPKIHPTKETNSAPSGAARACPTVEVASWSEADTPVSPKSLGNKTYIYIYTAATRMWFQCGPSKRLFGVKTRDNSSWTPLTVFGAGQTLLTHSNLAHTHTHTPRNLNFCRLQVCCDIGK